MKLFVDRIFRLPRIWSNRELAKFAPLFQGSVVNVSAWKDFDKERMYYREYFKTPYRSAGLGSQHTGADAQVALKQAQELVDSGKLDEADTLLETAIAGLSQDGSLHFARGLLHERRGEPVRAVESFATAVRLAPENPNYLKCLARQYHKTCGRSVEALGLLRQSFEKHSKDPSIHQLIAEILHTLGRAEEARYFRETAERLICEGRSQRVPMDSSSELRFYYPKAQTAL